MGTRPDTPSWLSPGRRPDANPLTPPNRSRNPNPNPSAEDQIFGWAEEGLLTPHVSHTFPLQQVQDAFFCLWNRDVIGKCVVIP